MTSDRKKPGVVFWTSLVLVVVPVLYVLSVGPACWWFARDAEFESFLPVRYAPQPYWPVGWIAKRSRPIRKLIGWYVGDLSIYLPADRSGDSWIDPSNPFD